MLALPAGARACGVTGLALHRTVGERTATLTWTVAKGTPPGSFAVLRNGTKVGQTVGRSFAVAVKPGRRYVFGVQAIDANGQGEPCIAKLKKNLRFQPPGRTPGLAVTGGGDRVRLVWSRAARGDG